MIALLRQMIESSQRSSSGSRCRRIKLSRAELRRRSFAGMRAREEINRHNAELFIDEHPMRRLAWFLANRKTR